MKRLSAFAAILLAMCFATPMSAENITSSLSGGGGGSGTVTTFSVVTANGVSASVANPTTTPAATFTLGAITPSTVSPSGITGATAASRYAGSTTGGSPVSGTFAVGDYVIDQTGPVWVCTVAGTPGTWSSTVATNANLTGPVTSVGNATSFGSFTSATLRAAISDETGTGVAVFATSPSLVTPILGTPTSGTLTNCTIPFSQASASTNTNALVIGTGGSLGASGSGTITATAVPFSGITTATNANTLTIGTGGSLTFSGTGTVNANQLGGTSIGTPTGTGNVVYSASPTLTGTLTAATITASGIISTSQAGALSASAVTFTGAPVTGGTTTTTFPLIYVNTSGAAAVSSFSTSGTMFGCNMPSGFSGNYIDLHTNGGTGNFIVSAGASVTCASVSASGQIATSKSGGASTSALQTTGAIYKAGTGTTNFPHFYIVDSGATASTTLSTGGTGIAINGHTSLGAMSNYMLDGVAQHTINGTGKTTVYNTVATAGWGQPAIYGAARSTGQTAAVASVAAYTVGAADGSFLISSNVNVTASTTHSFTVTCAYTDETNTARTLTLSFSQLSGTFLTAITNVQGVGAYEGIPLYIRCKAGTTIAIATTGTFTNVTYNVEGSITQMN